nr:hypothetical protein GCM10025732_35860 [Glycomyces mayteni]
MDLRLRGARADRAPRDGVGDVLRAQRLQELAADGQAGVEHVEEHAAGQAQAGLDVVGAVQVRVVDEALPADGGAGLLEVDAHDDEEVVRERGRGGGEAAGVVLGGGRIVHGAGADDEEEPVVVAGEDVVDGGAAVRDEGGAVGSQRQFAAEDGRGDERLEAAHAEVAGLRGVGWRAHRAGVSSGVQRRVGIHSELPGARPASTTNGRDGCLCRVAPGVRVVSASDRGLHPEPA